MIVIKIGGNAISQLQDDFFHQVKEWTKEGQQVVILHGGGQLISSTCAFFDLPTEKIDGIRVTPPSVLALTSHLLTNVIQPHFQNQLAQAGISALAVNQEAGPLFTADYLDQDAYGEVGEVTGIDESVLAEVSQAGNGQNPVLLVNSLAIGPNGPLNVNADSAAQALATMASADQLILLTDVPGVLVNEEVVTALNPLKANQLIDQELITAGMVPKLQAAFSALHHGVHKITITNHLGQGTKLEL
ncbi:acetylglutamate kinase [Fructobacillus cardui]|uniref:acetylglutamate kinase n=1 Tax=Fructobacillus cardui TaxID=2893170 RepID=UPI002DA1B3A9|nr:N-acetylglutamate kinase (ArgB) [Fructobacillus cardui]